MTRLTLSLVMILTFSIGVICSDFYRVNISHQIKVWFSQETELRNNLYQIRRAISLYAGDKEVLPDSLEELVKIGYLQEIPLDPMTGRNDWIVVMGDEPNSLDERLRVINVHSSSSAKSSEDTPYSDW